MIHEQLQTVLNRHCNDAAAQHPRKINQQRIKLKSLSLPNSKVVSIHHLQIRPFKPSVQKNMQLNKSLELKKIPHFWGCLIPSHLVKLQQKRISRLRSKTQQSANSSQYTKDLRRGTSSQFLKTKYMKRKQKLLNKNNAEDSDSFLNKIKKGVQNQRELKINSVITEYESPLQKYFQTQIKEQKRKKAEQIDIKIQRLTQVIKWRGRIIQKIQQQMNDIKYNNLFRD